MKTEPIESKPFQGPSSAQKPEQKHAQQSQLDPSLVTLEYSIRLLNEAIRNSPAKPGDSAYGNVVDQQILLQASAAISHLRWVLENERLEISIFKNTNTNLIRAINLLERSRSRIHRGETSAARIALRTLELQNKEQRAKPERDEATAFLQAELADGHRPAKEIIKTAKDLGISLKTLKRAKADLGITSKLDCTNQRAPQRAWYWSLPVTVDQAAADLPTPQTDQVVEPPPVAAVSAPSQHATTSIIAHPVSPDPNHFATPPLCHSATSPVPTPISTSKSKGGHQY